MMDHLASLTLVVLCLGAQASSALYEGGPNRAERLAFMMSGQFSSAEQQANDVERGYPPHPALNDTYYPIQTLTFGRAIQFYSEEQVQGKLVRRQVMVVEEDDRVVRLKPYNLDTPMTDTPWATDLEALEHEADDYFIYQAGCDVEFSEVADNVFYGIFPDCINFKPEDNVGFPMVITCEGIRSLIPGINVKPNVPIFVDLVEAYPLLPYATEGLLVTFEAPCQG